KFPTEEVVEGIKVNVPKLSRDAKAGSFVANAILTTDTFAKEGFVEFDHEGIRINLGGVAIGPGMFHPKMSRGLALVVIDFAKEGFVEFDHEGIRINLGGVAKGSGMIHPNMATMLAFVVTDFAIDEKLLQETVNYCVERSFNMITVDGDTSTNDMVAVLANGLAGNKKVVSKEDPAYSIFKEKLLELLIHLAKLIVSD